MRTSVKILDVADPAGGTVPMMFENMASERFCASLTIEQMLYLSARFEAIKLKLKAKEEPVS